MKNRLPSLPAFLALFFVPLIAFSQTKLAQITAGYDTIRIEDYNLLDYPGSSASIRDPYFRKVIHTIKPDILVVEEMTSQAGVNTFLSDVMNKYQSGLYSTITYHDDGSGLGSHIFYKSSKITFLSAAYIPTDLRDIGEYKVLINSSLDTLRLYAVHFKASQGFENDRLAEATILRNFLNGLPAGSKFLVMGDYNIYTSTEPAFQKLLESETDNDGRCKDPLNAVGDWHDGASFSSIHTQSTRTRQFGGGAPGGLDDRFDIMLQSYSSLDDNIITSHYTAYGNDGNHFNDSINRLPNTAVPDSVANALHYASDHLTIFCDFQFGQAFAAFSLISPANSSTGQPVSGTLRWHTSVDATAYDVYLDTNSTPVTVVSSNQTDTTYNYSSLNNNKKYYWKVVAKNGSASREATGSPWNFTTLAVPAAPTNVLLSGVTLDSLAFSWTDNATNETGYRIYRSSDISGPYIQIGPDLPVDSRDFSDAGLYLNHRYHYRIVPFNALGEGTYGEITVTTLAVVPGLPVLSDVGYISMTVGIDTSLNPPYTQFAVRVIQNSDTQYVQSSNILGSGAYWKTYAEWGGAGGIAVKGLQTCQALEVQVKGRNSENIETDFSEVSADTALCFWVTESFNSGWNLVSLPVTVSDNKKSIVFPGSNSNAFSYEGSYVQSDTLSYGKGYWLKFSSTNTVEIPGEPRTLDTVNVRKGWNIIGSISSDIFVDSIISVPGGIIVSPFYGFNGGYYNAGMISPGRGYWLKVNSAGKLIFHTDAIGLTAGKTSTNFNQNTVTESNSFTFEDCAGHKQTLFIGREAGLSKELPKYELPPVPPAGCFDVRFGSQCSTELIPESEKSSHDFPIAVQASDFPIKVSWEIADTDLKFYLNNDQENLASGGSILFNNLNGGLVLKVKSLISNTKPVKYLLYQNYPNPFNPSTSIKFDIPANSVVTLKVYNLIGEEVANILDNRSMEAGSHQFNFDASRLSTGVYLYRLSAAGMDGKTFISIKKLTLIK